MAELPRDLPEDPRPGRAAARAAPRWARLAHRGPTDPDTGERVEGLIFSDHLAEGLADARRAQEDG
jgi:hypothetical protein